MSEFNASLVREKIVFADPNRPGRDEASATIIRSNRIYLNIGNGEGRENIVIRTQTIPTTLRLASRVMFSYFKNGLFGKRKDPYDWQVQWGGLLTEYDRAFMPDLWGAVYIDGKPVFKTKANPFIDVVERVAVAHTENYNMTMDEAEQALRQIGHQLEVEHVSSVSGVFVDNDGGTRCGIIHRWDGKNMVFNFTAEGGRRQQRIVQALATSAAFLEAINMHRQIGIIKGKIARQEVSKTSADGRQLRAAIARMSVADKIVRDFEENYKVKYRPEKPNFFSEAAKENGDAE